MRLKITFLGCFLYWGTLYCQESNGNIQQLETKADSIYFNHTDYYKPKDFKRGILLYEQLLESLDDDSSLLYNKVLVKKLAAKAAYFEYDRQLDSAFFYSKKSIALQNKIRPQNLLLKGLTYKRLYKQFWASKEIDSMIVTAKKARQIFTDTIGPNHKLIADAIFDLGMAYSRKGLRDKNIEYYKKAIAMNIAHKGEFTPDAAIQEHHLALTYGFIGFYKKELESYKKVVKRWETIKNYKDMSYLSIAYSSLSTWYLQHGDVKTAETYLLKQETLIKERKQDLKHWFNETFKGRTQTRIWYNKANLALNKKDTLIATEYNNRVLEFIDKFDRNDPINNPHNLSYSNNFVDLQQMKSLRLKAKTVRKIEPKEANAIDEKILKLENMVGYFKDKEELLSFLREEYELTNMLYNISFFLSITSFVILLTRVLNKFRRRRRRRRR
jgi:tetratricopeptide (TPR) repeat protein